MAELCSRFMALYCVRDYVVLYIFGTLFRVEIGLIINWNLEISRISVSINMIIIIVISSSSPPPPLIVVVAVETLLLLWSFTLLPHENILICHWFTGLYNVACSSVTASLPVCTIMRPAAVSLSVSLSVQSWGLQQCHCHSPCLYKCSMQQCHCPSPCLYNHEACSSVTVTLPVCTNVACSSVTVRLPVCIIVRPAAVSLSLSLSVQSCSMQQRHCHSPCLYNHEACSSVTVTLPVCTIMRPAAVSLSVSLSVQM